MADSERGPKAGIGAKYDTIGAAYSRRYADPAAIASAQLRALSSWGSPLPAPARVLELGCADGLVTEQLAREGYSVHAIDLSPVMCEATRERLDRAGLTATVESGDIDDLPIDGEYDAVLGVMGSFFSYTESAARLLARLRRATRRKLIVDADPRRIKPQAALAAVQVAGFVRTDWRGHFVPRRRTMGAVGGGVLRAAEVTPGLRGLLLIRNGQILIKGETSPRHPHRAPTTSREPPPPQ